MKKKKFKVTDTMQKVAVDILEELECYFMTAKNVPEEVIDIYKRMYKKYELCNDPFTQMVCTTKEFFKNCHERDKQLMIERYGHCDGLE